jgi:hypothetical protein
VTLPSDIRVTAPAVPSLHAVDAQTFNDCESSETLRNNPHASFVPPVACVVVTFEIGRDVLPVLEAILPQIDRVFIVDNGSGGETRDALPGADRNALPEGEFQVLRREIPKRPPGIRTGESLGGTRHRYRRSVLIPSAPEVQARYAHVFPGMMV